MDDIRIANDPHNDISNRGGNLLKPPLARELEYKPGEIVEYTPGTEALITPDIDESLDEQRLKSAFWRAFRKLGEWYEAIPPY